MKFPFKGKKVFYLFFIILNTFLVEAQSVKELQHLISKQELTKKEQINILYTLSRELTYVDNIKSLEYAEEALKLATEINDLDGIAYNYRILSSIYAINDNYFMSMEYIQKALDIFENRGNAEGVANCYISLGHIYRSLNNHEQEIYFHKKSFQDFHRLGIIERIGVSAHNLGESYYNNKEFTKADSLTRMAMQINDSILNLPVLSSCYKVMGLIKENQQQVDSASYYFKKVIKISDKLADDAQKIATVEALLHLAAMAKSIKNYELQYKYLRQAESFCEKFNLKKNLLKVYYEMQYFFLNENKISKAKFYLSAYDELSKDISKVQLEDRNKLIKSVSSVHQLNKTTQKLLKENTAQASSIFYRNISLFITVFFLIGMFVFLKEFKQKNNELQSQNETINEQKLELQELNAAKNKFFSIVAHDLRSPLTSLKSFSSVLVEQIDFISKEEIQIMGENVSSSLDNILKMADNLIIWAQSQMNIIVDKKESINVKEIINDICEIFKVIAKNKEVKLISSVIGDPYLVGDKNQVEFIIRNLINNAIKFTPRKGVVNVSATQTSRYIEIVVSDTGVGMSPEFSKNLFSIQKPKGILGTEGEKGSGLGLVLSSEFIKRNKGEIHVESQEAHGTTVTLTFESTKLGILNKKRHDSK